ncbi:thiamine/thiamine pyrophosphate ABC transporter permease ThiP [Devosia sp. XJ19-1]|uniref:Thiamine/thiamine pyrophosphate ABC transporter permease ThiP n=1 Tax=Devosia ureilytica TaxID=2952754 RepID=A0A9Q4FS80_9HYPH|nr:thiamine/thiamine pyrophosphate ABC transporter permease ThiP [Devosia ureilytica]MCP8884631.1 thiamine/thiamine pyrophosphate ABC transporter permease ThiP [Devosia ureilytica]MCP8888261.1 thiamine/thiamine pyrophosphate ABC transporter permease ThiP [Devosia ureilytica]
MLTLPRRPLRIATATGLTLIIAALIVAVLWAILDAATGASGGSRVDLAHLLRMTALQAGLTMVLSLGVGVAVAWALNRLRFFGRDLVVGLFAAAIVTPGMVVAFGLLSIWGRNGWINQAAQSLFGFSFDSPAYGLSGILIAHVVLDGAFAARILLARLDAIAQSRLKVGQSLGLGAVQRFRLIDWPAMRGSLPGLGAIIFLLAFTSFPIVLLLGGGPANQTLEVAIYTAVRLDFDLAGAVRLALTQIAVCSVVILIASAFTPVPSALSRSAQPNWRDARPVRAVQWLVLVLATLGFALPLLNVLYEGLAGGLFRVLEQASFWRATATSVIIGASSAALTLALALVLALGRSATAQRVGRTLLGVPAYAYLAVPAVVLSLGFFLLVRALGVPSGAAAPVVVVIANSLLSLPFAMATLGPPLDAVLRSRGKLIRSLGLSGWQQFTAIEYPLLGRDIGLMLALAFCFSLGDLGVIALFGTQDFQTLPLMMYRALGSYRSNDAAAIAALLLIFTIAAFVGLPRLIERIAHAPRR